ncbi:hypothetical protein Lser_V15G40719 [Lactuca serriola]
MVGPEHNPLQTTRIDGRSIFSASDNNVIMKVVMDTHYPDDTAVDVKSLLKITEDILPHATIKADPISSGPHTNKDIPNGGLDQTDVAVMLDSQSHIIDKITSELKLPRDGHTTALAVLEKVSKFQWDAKLVLTLAALAINYKELWMLTQMHSSNQLAKSIQTIMAHTALLKPQLDALNKLVYSILELTRCIIQFNELPSMDITLDLPPINTIPIAIYWNIRGIIMCATMIADLTIKDHEIMVSSSALQLWELSTLTVKIDRINEFLRQKLDNYKRVVGDKKEIEFRRSFSQLFETSYMDNMKILKILITPRDDILPLFDGKTKKRVSLEFLRKKNVLLLISGVEMSSEELSILEEIYMESRIQGARGKALYEVVWMPIVSLSVEYTDEIDRKFEEMKNKMLWYSVSHPSIIDRAVIMSIGDRWHFRNRPIVVVLDPQGRELSPNALHMMLIWGNNAFPFTSLKEELLWRDETWRLEFLVGSMDPTILNWIKEDKHIFLFGGDDIDWIRKFTSKTRAMATDSWIPLEMVYVGQKKEKESVRRAVDVIKIEKLSDSWQQQTMRFFWTRLESMLYSKNQVKRADPEDPMMKQIMKLVSYDKEWALLCRGSKILTSGNGTTIMEALDGFMNRDTSIESKGFDSSFTAYLDRTHVPATVCCLFEFPAAGRVPNNVRCPECHRLMAKHIAFLCCHDQT